MTTIFVQSKSKVRKLVLIIFWSPYPCGSVVSSRMRNRRLNGEGTRQRIRCFWTAGKPVPRSPMTVSKPSGSLSTKSTQGDLCEALRIVLGHFGVAVGNVAVNGIGEQEHVCLAIPTEPRSFLRSYIPTGVLSTETVPPDTSEKRGIRLISGVLPQPVGP